MVATRYILAGTLIDGSGQPASHQVFLAITEGVISAIGSATEMAQADPGSITDLSQYVLMPTLVDCNVFLGRSPAIVDNGDGGGQVEKLVNRHLDYCRAYGVLGLAAGDGVEVLARLSDANSPFTLRFGAAIDCSSDGEKVQVERADFLRVCCNPDVDPQAPRTLASDKAGLDRIVQQASGRKVIGVANGREAVAAALAAGCHAIEQGYGMGEENLRLMAERSVLWLPSLLRAKNGVDSSGSGGDVCCRFSQRYVAPGKARPGDEQFWKETLADQLSQLRLARQLGVRIAVGTGAGSIGILHGESVTEEIKLLIKAGFSLEEAIGASSENGARFFGMDRLGALTVGKPATFIYTRGVTSQLPRKLAFIEGLMVEGKPVSIRNDGK